MADEDRSYDRFEDDDLKHLAELARRDLADFVQRRPHHHGLEGRLLCIALCQGGALHYVDGKNGVKDFDVWMFFSQNSEQPDYPVRLTHHADFEGERFQDSTGRVDILGRTLKVEAGADPAEALHDYLGQTKTPTAGHLAKKAVVLLEPASRRGEIVWPKSNP